MLDGDPIIQYGAGPGWGSGDSPFPWKADKAITFTQCAGWISVFLDPEVPISRAMVLLFMFHETRFSNIRQVVKGGFGPGVGLAQIEPMNSDKPEFFKAVYGIESRNNPELIETLLRNPVTSIRVQCDYYRFKYQKGVTGMRGLVMAQVGGSTQNAPLVDIFMNSEPKLRGAMGGAGDRTAIIAALNSCSYAIDPSSTTGLAYKPVPPTGYKRYWDFTLPGDVNLLYDLRR
jgi:hypothetical protein